MAPDGIGVAPSALHWIVEGQSLSAGRRIQRFGRADGERYGKSLPTPARDPILDRDLAAAACRLGRAAASREAGFLARASGGRRRPSERRNCTVANSAMRRLPPGDCAARNAGACRRKIAFECACRRPDGCCGKARGDVGQHRDLEARVAVHLRAWRLAGRSSRGTSAADAPARTRLRGSRSSKPPCRRARRLPNRRRSRSPPLAR